MFFSTENTKPTSTAGSGDLELGTEHLAEVPLQIIVPVNALNKVKQNSNGGSGTCSCAGGNNIGVSQTRLYYNFFLFGSSKQL